jgi:hypothetical protein
MESAVNNYWVFWLVYLLAASVFYGIFWKITRFLGAGWLAYMLRGVSAAIILTPWYTNSADGVLAPALMIVMLDGITIGSAAAVRSIVPLILAVILSLIVAGLLLFLNKYINNKNNDNK